MLDFYKYLFDEEGLSYSAVAGYRASMGDFLEALELKVGNHHLFRCFFSHHQRNLPK